MSSYWTYYEFLIVKGEIPIVEFPDYRGDINKRIYRGSQSISQQDNSETTKGGNE